MAGPRLHDRGPGGMAHKGHQHGTRAGPRPNRVQPAGSPTHGPCPGRAAERTPAHAPWPPEQQAHGCMAEAREAWPAMDTSTAQGQALGQTASSRQNHQPMGLALAGRPNGHQSIRSGHLNGRPTAAWPRPGRRGPTGAPARQNGKFQAERTPVDRMNATRT